MKSNERMRKRKCYAKCWIFSPEKCFQPSYSYYMFPQWNHIAWHHVSDRYGITIRIAYIIDFETYALGRAHTLVSIHVCGRGERKFYVNSHNSNNFIQCAKWASRKTLKLSHLPNSCLCSANFIKKWSTRLAASQNFQCYSGRNNSHFGFLFCTHHRGGTDFM